MMLFIYILKPEQSSGQVRLPFARRAVRQFTVKADVSGGRDEAKRYHLPFSPQAKQATEQNSHLK